MIVDGHVHIVAEAEPVWAFAKFDAEDMIRHMDGPYRVFGKDRKIDMAAAMPAIGLTAMDVSFKEQHRAVIDAVKRYPDRFVGTFVLNPRLGVQKGIDTLRELVRGGAFRMVKLHPTMHNYWPNKAPDLIYPILEEAAALDIPVLIHMGEPPYSIPSLAEPLAKDNPKTTIILAHLATQKICYADDAVNVAKHCPNVLLETGWAPLPRLLEAAKAVGPERLVFGSDCPPMDIFSQLRVVESIAAAPPLGLSWSERDVQLVMGGNLARLLKLGATKQAAMA